MALSLGACVALLALQHFARPMNGLHWSGENYSSDK